MQFDIFKKVFYCESFLRVILNSDYTSAGVSKSYYYYLLGKLRNLNLIQDNKINFSVVVPFKISNDFLIKFEPVIVLVNKKKKMLYLIDHKRCNVGDEELFKELNLNDGKRGMPCKRIIEEIFKYVMQIINERGAIYV